MNNKLAVRLAIGLFAIAALVLGYQWWRGIKSDPDFGAANTIDMIGAVMETSDGQQAVAFLANGELVLSPDYREGAVDRDFVWRPDGGRAFFLSDRKDGIHIFRWNPDRGSLQQRSVDGGSKGTMVYGPLGLPATDQSALLTAGGRVLRYDPSVPATYQVLPPRQKERSGTEEGGTSGQFEGHYSRLGTSFKKAVWGKDRRWIIAVMRREVGEILVLQSMTPLKDINTGDTKFTPPSAITAGKRVDFDITADGRVVVAIVGFQFPDPAKAPKEFIKNGRVVPPYENAITFFDPDRTEQDGLRAIGILTPEIGAIEPRISPDGTKVLLSIGAPDPDGNVEVGGLVSMPLIEQGADQGTPLVRGKVQQPNWHPSGQRIVYVKREENGVRSVFTIDADGANERRISDGKSNFQQAVFSPQLKP